MMSTPRAIGVGVVVGTLLLTAGSALAQPFNEDYNFGATYVAGFAQKGHGPDMLPFTADDPVVTLNLNGSLSCDVIDLNGGAGGVNLDWSFHNRKVDDDEQISLTAHSEFNLGIIAHGEIWCDMRQDNAGGATDGGPDGTPTSWSSDDWDLETNDSSSTVFSGWEGASDYWWYNNLAANQRGLGGSKYYFEYKNPDLYPGTVIFDEPEKYRLANRLRHTWAANPGNGEKRTYFATNFNLEVRGYLIPISELATLADGSLHPLFGWQALDMAKYMREKIAPLFDAAGNPVAGTDVWDPSAGGYSDPNSDNPPPYKYVMVYETSDVVTIGPPGTNVAAAAAYYGVTDGVSGTRRSHIVFKGDSVANLPIDLTPPADGMKNSWGRDEMRRDNYTRPDPNGYGNLVVGKVGNPPTNTEGWLFDQADFAATDSKSIYLPSGTASSEAWIKLPTLKLPAKQLKPLKAEVYLSVYTGGSTANDIHLALVDGTSVAAFASFSQGGPATVGVGGSVATGPVTGASGSTTGATNVSVATDYPGTKLELFYDATNGSVSLDVDDVQVASHVAGAAGLGTVSAIYLWTSSGDTVSIDSLAVQSGQFTCNTPAQDLNGDNDVDLEDFAAFSACFNGPNNPHTTGMLPSCACFDSDVDFDVDLVDFAAFAACFNGPNSQPACAM